MGKSVTVIPSIAEQEMAQYLKVAAYCRVSTDYEEQTSSLKAQVAHFTGIINGNPNWQFAGVYAERESGTQVENRNELNRMLADCEAGSIDLILTKSMSRFGRNTLDTFLLLDRLLKLDVEVRFELEGICTKDKRVLEAIAGAAAFAQDESRAKSENIKWGIRRSVERGHIALNHSQFLGYTKGKDGQLVIVEDEAKIVRLIFDLYLQGHGCRRIKKHLERNGIKTVTGKAQWSTSTIDRILSNEKYMGSVITQKTYVKDYLSHKQVRNQGELTQYLIENNHESIIDPEMFERVQERKGLSL